MSALDDAITALQANEQQVSADVTAVQNALTSADGLIATLNQEVANLQANNASPAQIQALQQISAGLAAAHDAVASAVASAAAATATGGVTAP